MQKLGNNLFQKKKKKTKTKKQTRLNAFPYKANKEQTLPHHNLLSRTLLWNILNVKGSFAPPTEVLNDITIKNRGYFKVHVRHNKKNQGKNTKYTTY